MFTGLKNQITQHWRGKLSLWFAFSVNLVLLGAFILASFYLPWSIIAAKIGQPLLPVVWALMGFIVITVIWQITGMLRTLHKHTEGIGGTNDSWVIYVAILAYMWFLFLSVLDLTRFTHIDIPDPVEVFSFQLELQPLATGASLLIKGDLDFGLTRQVKQILQEHPELNKLVLDSRGGIVSEARGVARLARVHQLATHVDKECYSACTIIFISSSTRTISRKATLGFHRYRLDTSHNSPWFNTEKHQRTDADAMRAQGIDQNFIDRAYSEPPEGIWTPDHETLIAAGVVHSIVDLDKVDQ